MAINTPAELNVIDPGTIWGRRPFDTEPLDSILENVNWLYKNYTPAIYNACPVNGSTTVAKDFYFPFAASADNLNYTLYAYIWTSASATVDLDFYESSTGTTGSPWGSAAASTTFSAALGGRYVSLDLGQILSTTDFGRCVFTPQVSGSPTMQVQWVMIVPTPAAITSATRSSGAIAYDGAHLNGTGSAIHTEYADRAIQTAAAILQDRRQCVFSYQQMSNSGNQLATRGSQVVRLAAYGQTHLMGQHDSIMTVQCRAVDSGTATVRLYEVGVSDVLVEFDADDTDRGATIRFKSPAPIIEVVAEPDAGTTIRYLNITWSPTSIGTP